MAQQNGGQGPPDAAAAQPGAAAAGQGAAAGLPAPLAQLAEVLKAQFHNPSEICPQSLIETLFKADLGVFQPAEIDQIMPQLGRTVDALVIASTTQSFSTKHLKALTHSFTKLGVAFPDLSADADAAQGPNSAAGGKKSEYHFAAMRCSAVLAEGFNSLASLRASAANVKLARGFGIGPQSVEAFAKLHWQRMHAHPKKRTLLESIMDEMKGDDLPEVTLLCLAWSALAGFLEEVQPDNATADCAASFMVSVERAVIHPLLAEGCSPSEVMQVLEEHMLGPMADSLYEASDAVTPVAFNIWGQARLTLDMRAVCSRTLEQRRRDGGLLATAYQPKVLPATVLQELQRTAGVLFGGKLPARWRAICTAATACPLHTLVPELCPYGATGCPGVHHDEERRQDLIDEAFGDRHPFILNLWERATRAGEIARHKLNRPGTYVPVDKPVVPPLTSGGKKGSRQ